MLHTRRSIQEKEMEGGERGKKEYYIFNSYRGEAEKNLRARYIFGWNGRASATQGNSNS